MFAASAEMFFNQEQDTTQDRITPKSRTYNGAQHSTQAHIQKTQEKNSTTSTSTKEHMAVSANLSSSASALNLNLGLIPPARPKSVTRVAFLVASVIYCAISASMLLGSFGKPETKQLDVGGAVHTIGLEQFVAAPAPQEAIPKQVQTETEVKPEPISEPEPEVKPEPIPEAKPELKPEVKPLPEKKVEPKKVVKKQEVQSKVKQVKKTTPTPQVETKATVTNKTATASTGAPKSNRPQVMVYGRDNHPVLTQIKSAIDKALVYPRKAQMMRAEGVAVVQFTYTSGGQIKRLKLLKSTGTRELDKAALLTIKRASGNFPRVEQSFTLRLPIAFEIK